MRKEEHFQKGLDIWEAAGKRYIPEEAADEFRRAADLGHIKSMYYLCIYCEMPVDDYLNSHPRAENWLKKAAGAGGRGGGRDPSPPRAGLGGGGGGEKKTPPQRGGIFETLMQRSALGELGSPTGGLQTVLQSSER